jgi:uncharacterized protein YqhQ
MYDVKEDDFIKYIDNSEFLLCLTTAVLMLLLSFLLWPSLFLYSAIPLALANFIGCPKQDYFLLAIVNMFFGLWATLNFKNLNLFR